MTTYNSAVESATKAQVRGEIAGGASTRSEPISSEIISSFSGTVQGETWPEYTEGISLPSWIDDAILHDSTGDRLQARQIQTKIAETQVYGEPSPYGPPPQTQQRYFFGSND